MTEWILQCGRIIVWMVLWSFNERHKLLLFDKDLLIMHPVHSISCLQSIGWIPLVLGHQCVMLLDISIIGPILMHLEPTPGRYILIWFFLHIKFFFSARQEPLKCNNARYTLDNVVNSQGGSQNRMSTSIVICGRLVINLLRSVGYGSSADSYLFAFPSDT